MRYVYVFTARMCLLLVNYLQSAAVARPMQIPEEILALFQRRADCA
jgi:hypothetical protein